MEIKVVEISGTLLYFVYHLGMFHGKTYDACILNATDVRVYQGGTVACIPNVGTILLH